MPWAVAAAAVGAAGSIYASSQTSKASSNASAQQMQMYQTTRNDLMPYNLAGMNAVNALSSYWGLGGQPGGGGGTGGFNLNTNVGSPYGGGYNPYGGLNNGGFDQYGWPIGLDAKSGKMGGFSQAISAPIGLGNFDPLTGSVAAPLNHLLGIGRKNNSPLQDIKQAMYAGLPISDAAWAKAGLPPGGGPMFQQQAMQGGGGQGGGLTAGSASNAFDMLKNYPGYQFQYGQGLEALNRNLSAGGRYTSGAMMKDAQTFGQGQAESAVGNYLQMLQYLGTLGQNSAAQTGSLGAGAAARAGQFGVGGAQAAGQGIMGAANTVGGLFQSPNFQSLFGGGSMNAPYMAQPGISSLPPSVANPTIGAPFIPY